MESFSILDLTVGSGQCEGKHPRGGKCREPLDYPTSVCYICNTPVQWTENMASAMRKRKLGPTDDLGKKMLKKMGINNFQTATQRQRWEEMVKVIPESQIQETWEGCGTKAKRHGWLRYTLNRLNWLIENGEVEQAVAEVEFDPNAEFIP